MFTHLKSSFLLTITPIWLNFYKLWLLVCHIPLIMSVFKNSRIACTVSSRNIGASVSVAISAVPSSVHFTMEYVCTKCPFLGFLSVVEQVLHLHVLCLELHYLCGTWSCCPLVGHTSFSLNFAFRFEIGVELEILKSNKSLNKQVEKLSCFNSTIVLMSVHLCFSLWQP